MIDPVTALAGIQSAISMVKKAAKVANDLGSLAPMIGKMFDAKSVATKALIQAKQDKNLANRQIDRQLFDKHIFKGKAKHGENHQDWAANSIAQLADPTLVFANLAAM